MGGAETALANHGPGTSGGGSSTASGETLKANAWELSTRLDFTEFEHIDRDQAERIALRSEEFDAIRRSVIASASVAYGITDDLQAGAQIGYYWGSDFIDAESEDGIDSESGTGDPSGLTDLWITAKYRFLKGQPGNLAVFGGVKLPTGDDDERLDNGELLEPSSQPGSGAFDFQLGLAYSRYLTSHITFDTSAAYTFRTEHDDFKVGDRFDAGAALAYRLTDSVQDFPNWSAFGEILVVHLEKDRDESERNPNSGGTTLYLSPGFRVRFNPHASLTVAPAFPVLQDLNGEQVETRFKIGVSLDFSF